jgi:hypothetical protein
MRHEARIRVTIWQDPEFVALGAGAQRLYLLLLSQPDLSWCGLLPLLPGRWAAMSAETKPADVLVALEELAVARFVLVDEETQEVFVRTLMRNDGVWKNPRVWGVAVREAMSTVSSPALRAEALAEIQRIEHGEVSGEVSGEVNGEVSREVSRKVSRKVSSPIPIANTNSTRGLRTPLPTPLGAPSPYPRRVPSRERDGLAHEWAATAPDDEESAKDLALVTWPHDPEMRTAAVKAWRARPVPML